MNLAKFIKNGKISSKEEKLASILLTAYSLGEEINNSSKAEKIVQFEKMEELFILAKKLILE
jgi:hypothetical protein